MTPTPRVSGRAYEIDQYRRDVRSSIFLQERSSSCVLEEAGLGAPSYPTVKRHLPVFAADDFREALAAVCADHAGLGTGVLVLYDVTTLFFETDTADEFRVPGFSKERRLEPQITIGLLVDASGFPLRVQAFEGNKAETTTMLPTIEAFKAAHRLSDVTIVADAGMVSAGNQAAIEAAGLTYILGAKIPNVPYQVDQWRKTHVGQDIPDGHVFTQPWPANAKEKAAGQHDRTIFYRYQADRARRTLRGIDEQVGKAEQAVAGKVPVKRNRIVTLSGGDRAVNRDLEAKARGAGRHQGLRHQPARPDRRHGDLRLPPALAGGEVLPHVQTRPAS